MLIFLFSIFRDDSSFFLLRADSTLFMVSFCYICKTDNEQAPSKKTQDRGLPISGCV